MEGICKDQLDLRQVTDIFWIFEDIQYQSFDGGLSSYRHENRSSQRDTIERYLSDSRLSYLLEYFEIKLIHKKKEKINVLFLYDYARKIQLVNLSSRAEQPVPYLLRDGDLKFRLLPRFTPRNDIKKIH